MHKPLPIPRCPLPDKLTTAAIHPGSPVWWGFPEHHAAQQKSKAVRKQGYQEDNFFPADAGLLEDTEQGAFFQRAV